MAKPYDPDRAPSFNQREILQLEERIARDESRMDIISESLIERDLLIHSKETDDLIEEWHNLNFRIEQGKNRIALLKSPSQLTEEDKDRISKAWHPDERNNIRY